MNIPESFDLNNRKTVCVQGLGFVGAAMAIAVASSKDKNNNPMYNVIGIDVPNEAGYKKADSLNKAVFPFENNDINLQNALETVSDNGNFIAVTESDYFKYADVVVVDINLDVKYDNDQNPILDLTMFKEAMHTIGHKIKEETLVIIETTVPPGTCSKVVYPILFSEFSERGLNTDKIYIAHSYERVMPGENYFNSIINYWRVYSGINNESADKCEEFLKTVISTDQYPLTRLNNTNSTEIAKVLENSYRATTIAFMEEWGRFAEAVGVDLFEVINAIRMRPTHSNMRQPGFGVGGYCLTKDPYFAKLAAKDLFGLAGMDFPFCSMAVKTNNKMPIVSLDKIEDYFGGSIKDKSILVMGVSYRQDVGDTRYSPSEIFVKEAINRGASITVQDPLVKDWPEMKLNVVNEIPDFKDYDVIIFTVQHKQYNDIDFKKYLYKKGALIFDSNCVLTKHQINDIRATQDVYLRSIGRGEL